MIKELDYPFTLQKVKQLRVDEMVNLSGKVFTGRDRLHAYLFEGGKCPVDLKDGAIYHCGPVMVRKDRMWVVRSAGPTTSIRQEPFMPWIIEHLKVRVIIGKGGMGEATRRACVKQGCVYLQAVGGAAALLASSIEQVGAVHFMKEFGAADAMWELAIKDLKAVVTIDATGRSLHKRIRISSKRALKSISGVDGVKK